MQFDAIEPGVYPELIYPPYKSTVKRGPTQAPLRVRDEIATGTNLFASPKLILPHDMDLTKQGRGEPLGLAPRRRPGTVLVQGAGGMLAAGSVLLLSSST